MNTRSSPAIPDLITVVGSSYFQPIADLVEILIKRPAPDPYPAGTSSRENGYCASLVLLLVAMLESYASRLRFLRPQEVTSGRSTPDLLSDLFSDLPSKTELIEVFLVRNVIAHNHIWHLDVSDVENKGAPTLATPNQLGFSTNKHYTDVVDDTSRRTRLLSLAATPTAVDRSDVRKVFDAVWTTLRFMSKKQYAHTPMPPSVVRFEGRLVTIETVREALDRASPKNAI